MSSSLYYPLITLQMWRVSLYLSHSIHISQVQYYSSPLTGREQSLSQLECHSLPVLQRASHSFTQSVTLHRAAEEQSLSQLECHSLPVLQRASHSFTQSVTLFTVLQKSSPYLSWSVTLFPCCRRPVIVSCAVSLSTVLQRA